MKFDNISGDRINLIEIYNGHLDDLYEYAKDPIFFKYLEFSNDNNINETQTYLNKLLYRNSLDNCHYWFIQEKSSMKVIGTFGVLDIDARKRSAEIGYGISPQFWGQGYFKETLKLVLNYLFHDKDFHRIWAKTHANNTSSVESLKKLGFKHEGILRDFYLNFNDNIYSDAVMLAKLKQEHIG